MTHGRSRGEKGQIKEEELKPTGQPIPVPYSTTDTCNSKVSIGVPVPLDPSFLHPKIRGVTPCFIAMNRKETVPRVLEEGSGE